MSSHELSDETLGKLYYPIMINEANSCAGVQMSTNSCVPRERDGEANTPDDNIPRNAHTGKISEVMNVDSDAESLKIV